jgi:signal transduction histidine kinase
LGVGLDFRSPIDDDSHTLLDGALPRFLRMRKWCLFVAFVLIVLDLSWFDYAGIASKLSFTGLPREFVREVATGVGLYLFVQSVLVTSQILIFLRQAISTRVDLVVRYHVAPIEKQIAKYEDREDLSKADQALVEDLKVRRQKINERTRAQRFYIAVTEIVFDAWRIGTTIVLLSYALLRHGDVTFDTLSRGIAQHLP